MATRNAHCFRAARSWMLRPKRQDGSTCAFLVLRSCSRAQLLFIVPRKFSFVKGSRNPGPYVLEKSGDDGKTADKDTRCKLSVCPKAHLNHVVGYIRRCSYFPCVVGPQNGRNTSAANAISEMLEMFGHLLEICVELNQQDFARFKHHGGSTMYTYRKPVANTAVIRILFLEDSCSFQTDGMGRMKIAKSDITLKIPLALNVA